ncbi:ATP-dependent RNA helicase HrpA [Aliikangiella sp. IMCC44359]|uniref:ATP-dependent RNA helicase HrpA n=1 Tax=Aliikangiella sp. IMCC44359 TaxID=3459125 RepID=UPI00403AB454
MQINEVQTKDIGKLISLNRSIQQRLKKKQPVEHLQIKLTDLESRSKLKTEQIKQQISHVKLVQDLPITQHAEEIAKLLLTNQVVIVAGETGCGKTTQLPKICLQAGFGARGVIGHTQPRRVAATSVAKRIADELECELGGLAGYAIRFHNKYSDSTRIKLMTDGVLLSEIENDPLLTRYEVIIIDEAHERSLNIDFLLGFLKRILPKRKDLRVIITSATIDPQRFSDNFNQAPIVLVEGRSYPVEVRYRPLIDESSENSDRLMDAITEAVEECCEHSTGDILIFADGEGQIKSIIKGLKDTVDEALDILPLYARLGVSEQQKIFSPSGKRKVIVSTNVAETSLTVPGIVFVIDIGHARISRFSQRNKIQQLPVEKISRASAEQRKGRCGRVAPGVCIRLYNEDDYLAREEFTLPEIKRTNLSSVVLRLKAMKVEQIEKFPFIEAPDERAWKVAFNSLFELGALNEDKSITQIGKDMARMPVDPQLARILVDKQLLAVNEMLVFCALMSVREVRERPHDKQQKADQLHQKYQQGDSDILTAINLWNQLEAQKVELNSNAFKKWCVKNMINFLGVLEWRRVYYQLKESFESLGRKLNQEPVQAEEVHRALIPGFITHIFYRSQDVYYQGVRGLKVWLHPSSLSFKQKKPWLISAEMIETEKFYARMNAQIQPEWIEPVAEHLLKSHYNDIHWRKKRGQVVAYVNKSLLGLPIVSNRLINYSSVDQQACRHLFLTDGLASDQLAEDFPFLKANREKLFELDQQEQKQRLNNIRLDKESLAELYAETLPNHIVSTISLKRWLKKDYKTRNQQLSFSLEQLTQNTSQEPEAYPSQIKVKGVVLNLSYCFAPGTKEDGVSVEIPHNMISQFNDRDFDWLVPGYLQEKILASIKALPKSVRRSLIPLSETADKCYAKLIEIDQTGKKFLDELAKVLQRESGIQIKVNDFDMSSVDNHLSMKYKVLNKRNTSLQTSLSEIKKQRSNNQPKENAQAQKNQLKAWPSDDFLIESKVDEQQQSVRIFQAMKDCEEFVEVKQCPSKEVAESIHLIGVSRLLILDNYSQLNQFYKSWPDYKRLERLNIRFGGFKALFQMLALIAAKHQVLPSHPITTKLVFNQVSQRFKSQFRQALSDKLSQLLPLLKQREQLFSTIAELNMQSYETSIMDMKSQLKALWSIENLLIAGDSFVENYERYHKALEVRIKRITTNYPKESQSMEIWQDWHEWWQELQTYSAKQEVKALYDQLFWMLQEFRVSLFSPGIKTAGSISAKKLQKHFELIETELDAI